MTQTNPTTHCDSCPSRVESIFCHLSDNLLTEMDSTKVTNQYQRGQILFYESSPNTGIFCIYDGKVKLVKNGADGKETLLRICGQGAVLGYESLMTNEGYHFTAQVTEDATICHIDKQFFTQLIEKSPDLAMQVISRLGEEVQAQGDRISDMQSRNVKQRLCNLLVALSKTYGEKDPRGTLLNLRLSRAELASWVGATTETLIRTLTELNDEGSIVLDGKKIIVCKVKELMRTYCSDF